LKSPLKITALLTLFLSIIAADFLPAEVPDVSDDAIADFLESPFQYDYTLITDDSGLRDFVDALDGQLAVIEYRQRLEFTAPPGETELKKQFKSDLESRYRDLMNDRFIFKKLSDWRDKSEDPVNRAFIRFYMLRRLEFTSDPTIINQARELSERIANRFYSFRFRIDGEKITIEQAADSIFGGDYQTARILNALVNDSVAVLASLGSQLYQLYLVMGQQRGYRTSLDYNLDRLSFEKTEWFKIASRLKGATDDEYRACLKELKKEAGTDHLALFEIERRINGQAVLPDSCFSAEKIDAAIGDLLNSLGLDSLLREVSVRIDSTQLPALAIRLYPPDHNLLLRNNRDGFANYRRLVNELGRLLPWVYADSTIPYILRDYPPGSEETVTGLFEYLALQPDFLSDHFDIEPTDLERFETYRKWQVVAEIRRILMYFYFDFYLSEGKAAGPASLYSSLEDTLFATGGNSYSWIETLLTGAMESFPEKLAERFTLIKLVEILRERFGGNFVGNPETGGFLKEKFCRPGRLQTIEDFIDEYAPDKLSVDDLKRQYDLK